MREETLNPMQEAIAFGRVIPGAAAEFTNEPRAEEFYSDAFSAEGNENSALREAAKPNAERQSEAVKKGTNGGGTGGSGGGFDRWRFGRIPNADSVFDSGDIGGSGDNCGRLGQQAEDSCRKLQTYGGKHVPCSLS
mgnify:CR=1 FL=1